MAGIIILSKRRTRGEEILHKKKKIKTVFSLEYVSSSCSSNRVFSVIFQGEGEAVFNFLFTLTISLFPFSS